MQISTLTLKNFRNYEEEVFEFDNGINILTGENAQGKTNAAEAIFFLCTGYSPRANKDKMVIRNGTDTAEIAGSAISGYGKVTVKINFNKSDNKEIYINGLRVLRIGELLGNIHSVFFNPGELKLVQESPEDRRRFLNISLSQMNKAYFYALQRYNKILFQRNNLLKEPNRQMVEDTLPIWDRQLANEGGKIIKSRNEFLATLAPIAEEKHALLSGGAETLKMRTESGYSGTEEEIADALYQNLKDCVGRDLRLGFTSIGPHRDDIKFILNGEDVRHFGSQGQQRTVALAVKLAETETFNARFGEYPILILDDVLSELDKKRQRKLISAVEHMQTVFTATGLDRTVFRDKTATRIIVERGKIKKKEKIEKKPKQI